MPPAAPENIAAPAGTEQDQISQNLDAILKFYTREEQKIGHTQRMVEHFSVFIGRPIFLAVTLLVVVLWVVANAAMGMAGMDEFDPAPYFWLQGIITLAALLITTVVLITQNRLANLEERRAHLDLKVTLLTEQKVAKLIELIEELRRDLPNVRDRHDAEAVSLKQSMNPELVLAALDESEPGERLAPDGGGKADADVLL
jgi:uncharacterized membrane protein